MNNSEPNKINGFFNRQLKIGYFLPPKKMDACNQPSLKKNTNATLGDSVHR